MTPLLPEVAGKHKAAKTDVRVSRRPFVLVVVTTLVAEVVAIWTTSKADVSVLVPGVLALGLGVVGLVVAYVLDVFSFKSAMRAASWLVLGEREPSPTYRRGFRLIALSHIVVAVAGAIWLLPLKMWMAEGQASRVAEQMLSYRGCNSSSSDLSVVGLLMSAREVCAYGQSPATVFGSPHPSVWFRDTSSQYQGNGISKGLIFAPSGLSSIDGFIFAPSGLRSLFDDTICVRHLVGTWWAYDLDPYRQGTCPVLYDPPLPTGVVSG